MVAQVHNSPCLSLTLCLHVSAIAYRSSSFCRFFCAPERKFLFSSRVDDGRCDCCDGSDELKSPEHKCLTSCAAFEHQEAEAKERHRKALALRKRYVEESRGAAVGEYGADNAFWPLSKKCFKKTQGKFV